MKFYKKLCVVLLFSTIKVQNVHACSDETGLQRSKQCNYLINHEFCEGSLLPEDVKGKQTLEEVHTFAKLKEDPRSSLPESFTVCSTAMPTDCQNNYAPRYFIILDNKLDQLLAAYLKSSIESGLYLGISSRQLSLMFGKLKSLHHFQTNALCVKGGP